MSVDVFGREFGYISRIKLPNENKKLGDMLTFFDDVVYLLRINKDEFWENHSRGDFLRLLMCKEEAKELWLQKNEKNLKKISRKHRKKLKSKYLNDVVLYDNMIDSSLFNSIKKGNYYDYINLSRGYFHVHDFDILDFGNFELDVDALQKIFDNVKVCDGLQIRFLKNRKGRDCLEYLSKIVYGKGVAIEFPYCDIDDELITILAKNLKMKYGMKLHFGWNKIGDEGLKKLSGMYFKEGVHLMLNDNKIGDTGITFMIKNLRVKNGMVIDLCNNPISSSAKKSLEVWQAKLNADKMNVKILF